MGCPFSALWQTVTGKSMKAPHPVTTNNSEELASPSRRSLLMGLGAAGGALALGGLASRSALAAPKPAAILPDDAKLQKQPFYGQYQSGITTPQQAAMMLVAFDILATNKADLTRLFKLLTERCVFLMQGGQPVQARIQVRSATLSNLSG